MTTDEKAKPQAAADQAGAPMNPQQAEMLKLALAQAHNVLRKVPLLGPVTWLMMSSPSHKFVPVADFEWRILPPIVLDQVKLYMREDAPMAFASWAFLDADAELRYRQTGRLLPPDWKSGDRAWLIDLIASAPVIEEVLRDLKTGTTSLAGRRVRMLLAEAPGKEKPFTEF
jgi:cytolysin-activating lysine-acyltransferase